MQSIPYRPLPKIVAKAPALFQSTNLQVGNKVKVYHGVLGSGFWREYEVTIIDGDRCRLVTRNKKFHLVKKTIEIEKLFNLQQQLASGRFLQ